MYNFEVTSSHCWWGRLDKVELAFHRLDDSHSMHIKFDNNRSDSFGDYQSNKNRHRRRTDRQTETGLLFFHSLGVMTHRENIKLPSRPMDSITSFRSRSKNENLLSHITNI